MFQTACAYTIFNILSVRFEILWRKRNWFIYTKSVVTNLFCAAVHLESKPWLKPWTACVSWHSQY
jgi:hypothetical protein